MNHKIYVLYCPKENIIRYIGVTRQKLKIRFKDHLRDDSNPYKANWIRKIRREGFEPEIRIVAENLSEKEAYSKEKELVSLLRQMLGKKLTNIADGGKTPVVKKRKVLQYDFDGKLIKSHNSGTRKIAETLNINRRSLRNALIGKSSSYKGFVWRYEGDDFNKFPVPKPKKPVYKICPKKNVILSYYESETEASRDSGCKRVRDACRGIIKTSGGFIWRYAEDVAITYKETA